MPRSAKAPLLALAMALAPAAALAAPDAAPLPGKLLLEGRLRYEHLDQAGFPDTADALTNRLRFGWETPAVGPFKALVEAETVAVLIDDYADGITPKPGSPTITDPRTFELNRAQLVWTGLPRTEVVLGRQRIVLNNARFVANNGWRQNEQTFDALRVTASPVKGLTLTYAFADRVNRSLGRDHPQGVWKGGAHLMEAGANTPVGTLTGYGYLLAFDNAPLQSSATWGARLAGSRLAFGKTAVTWEAEYARQGDYGDNPRRFDVDYRLLAGGLKTGASSFGLVYERLGGDGVNAFQTPLGSLHAFQGWADVIGATPAFGVRDVYLRGSTTLKTKLPVKIAAEAHDFRDADGAFRLGRELDAAVSAPLNKHVGVEIGVARFHGLRAGFSDTTRAWTAIDYRF